jgi:hypothetical protein
MAYRCRKIIAARRRIIGYAVFSRRVFPVFNTRLVCTPRLTKGIRYECNTQKMAGLPRGIVVVITALVIYIPLLFIVVQSFLSAPFFARSKEFSLGAFEFIFTDPDFYLALKSGFILAVGLVLIAIPLGGILAFLMVRTDLPGRRFIEPLILVPIFVSPWYWRLAMWSPPGRSVFSRNGQSNCWGLCRGISTRCSALW